MNRQFVVGENPLPHLGDVYVSSTFGKHHVSVKLCPEFIYYRPG